MNTYATPQPNPQDASLEGARAWFASKGLVRSREHRVIGGVTAPLAQRFGVNRLVARIGMVLAALLVSPVPYIVLWVLMPRE
jgi:phage shock protein C